MRNPTKKDRRKRQGMLSLELLLVLPVILIVVLAGVEFSLMFLAKQQLTAASREGARVASVGGNAMEVQNVVYFYLGAGNWQKATVQTILTDQSGNPLPSGAPVRVIVSIPAAQAVPDILGPFGFSIAQDVISAQTTMRKE
ncbi:MAG: TadE/TadG family type IV pilus assembly protein [Bdellovibrionales bacterium]